MYYIDSQRTVTRRESSLILAKKNVRAVDDRQEYEALSTGRGQSTMRLTSDSGVSLLPRPKCSIQKELVTILFESMLDSIVDTWEVIMQQKPEDSAPNMEIGKTSSEITMSNKKKKSIVKPSKTKRSRSKMEVYDAAQTDSIQQSWWSGPDERAIIRFRNGNIYEGNISMKCMHGEGRFQWTDGTIYLGLFKDNEVSGKGVIQWKDDTWYEGDFSGNLRHGQGLYVDSRKQRSYAGDWYCGTKHGHGTIYYSKSFKNSYNGQWIKNVRHGFGSREYCPLSGYKGGWDKHVREGKGLMIWPNHDFYRGEWKNGVMSGYGIYIWDAYYNNSMSLPSINAYRGHWERGRRNGYGILSLGLGLGSHYKGDFKDNKKHGTGNFVTNNGLILQDTNLFIDDNLAPILSQENQNNFSHDCKHPRLLEPYKFNICDDTVGLFYHIEEALKNMDKQKETRINIINDFIENNKAIETLVSGITYKEELPEEPCDINIEEFIIFEESSLRKALRCYESDLKYIYYTYATICNNEEIDFTPVLIRLYLWQLYYDCNIHEQGLILVDIDKIFHENPEWLARTPHSPFEKVYFWQFLHSLLSVASKLYAKKHLPSTKPDTILASAFRTFMERNIKPGVGRRKGRLTNGYGVFVPLKSLYDLYRSIGEPHTVRAFLCAVRRSPHNIDYPQLDLVEVSDECLPFGRNVYVFGDEMSFIIEKQHCIEEDEENKKPTDLKLFNFGNLSSKSIIKIFASIFPQICKNDKIMNLEIKLTFFEFFEAFIASTEESIKVKEEELRWREKFSLNNDLTAFLSTPFGYTNKSKI